MRVLKIIHTTGHGGAENIFRWLAQGLIKRELDVIVAIPARLKNVKEYWIGPAITELSIPHIEFENNGNSIRFYNELCKTIRKVAPDVVHSHLLDSNFYSALACKRSGFPHVCTEHGDIVLKNDLKTRLKFKILNAVSNSIVCVSEQLKRQASKISLMPSKLEVIYNGILFPEKFQSTFRSEFDIPEDAIVIGSVGNLYPVKGQKFLIRAFGCFLQTCSDAYLVLVGRGQEENFLKKLASQNEIPQDRIIFTGFRKDIDNILNGLDIYVQPSLSEGLPVAILEAISLNIPIIATAVGGVSEVLEKSQCGILVTPSSSEEIYFALKEIEQKKTHHLDKAVNGSIIVRDKFSVERMCSDYIQLYQRLIFKNE